jgi:hypothetical protein
MITIDEDDRAAPQNDRDLLGDGSPSAELTLPVSDCCGLRISNSRLMHGDSPAAGRGSARRGWRLSGGNALNYFSMRDDFRSKPDSFRVILRRSEG